MTQKNSLESEYVVGLSLSRMTYPLLERGNTMAETIRKAPKKVASPSGKTEGIKKSKTKSVVAKKTAIPKIAASRKTVKKTAPVKKSVAISEEQRYRMIAEAAYYRAESHHFKGDPLRDWIEAERDIAILLSEKP